MTVNRDQVREMLLAVLDVLREALEQQSSAAHIAALSAALARMPIPRALEQSLTVDERILEMLQEDPRRIAWPVREWARILQCLVSTVHQTAAWKRILVAHALERAERLETRRAKGA